MLQILFSTSAWAGAVNDAVVYGDVAALEQALAAGGSANEIVDERPALARAIERACNVNNDSPQRHVFDALLKAGAYGGAQVRSEPLLFQAIRGSCVGLIAPLIASGANPNAAFDSYGTPLEAAIAVDNVNIVDLLLTQGADPKRVINASSAVEYARSTGADPAIIDRIEKASR